ncbi:MAG: glycerol dehydrogenase [Pseudomonadota bacterium]|nr:glycerol dehydrogenase [Porticoccaceae bacterium]MEC7637290.1 glycerol dehydrogenase [Pseudomonadota bacterium]
MITKPFSPRDIFAQPVVNSSRVFLSPQRYIQGPGVIKNCGLYLSLINAKHVGVLASKRGFSAEAANVLQSLNEAGIEYSKAEFRGECSKEEIERHTNDLMSAKPDCILAVGGGKLVDAGKCIAYRLNCQVGIIPTLASNDAPCSSISVLYTVDGVKDVVEYFPQNPAFVIVDTEVIVNASERYLVAGIGDAMATWYEARVCEDNPVGSNLVGCRPTLAASAISEKCAQTLFEYGVSAAENVRNNQNSDSVERVVEANTLLSGIGFESGGLALAHPLANSYTEITRLNKKYLHGEMVAMGTLAQLAMENSEDLEKVTKFFIDIGLPVNLEQLSMHPLEQFEIDKVIDAAFKNPLIQRMKFEVTRDLILQSIKKADDLGTSFVKQYGDEAYKRLHD